MEKKIEVYLGDGVYATRDGWLLWLDLRGQDTTTRIALEPSVFSSLKDFYERVTRVDEGGAEDGRVRPNGEQEAEPAPPTADEEDDDDETS